MMTAGALTESLGFGSQTPINKSAVCVQKEPATKSWKVLALYRKRELASLVRGRGGIARFRYSDLKKAARVAADAGVM